MRKIKEYFENVYYKSFSSLGRSPIKGDKEKETMFNSLFIVIFLRLTLTVLFLTVVFYWLMPVEELKLWHWIVSIIPAYIISPLLALLVPKGMMYIPLWKEKDFLKGAYSPYPLTLIWLVPKLIP